MIGVSVYVRKGLPVRIVAEGHARRGPDGLSAACAAVSALLKGIGLVLVSDESCTVSGSVEETGRYDLEVIECRDSRRLSGIWALAQETLHAISREWPQEVMFTIIER